MTESQHYSQPKAMMKMTVTTFKQTIKIKLIKFKAKKGYMWYTRFVFYLDRCQDQGMNHITWP